MASIPSDDDVVAISDTLRLARLGTVWRKEDKGFGLHSNVYVGTANLRVPKPEPVAGPRIHAP